MSLPSETSPSLPWENDYASLKASQLEIRQPEGPSPSARIVVTPVARAHATDGESDSIHTLMKKSMRKKLKAKSRSQMSSIATERIQEPRTGNVPYVTASEYSYGPEHGLSETWKESQATPVTAFHDVVASNTGFSPINPSAPLPNALGAVPATPVPDQPPQVLIPTPAPKVAKAPSLPPLPPSIPATPVVYRPPYRELRPQLFQDAFLESVNGAKFDDMKIRVFSARTKAGVAHKPRTLHARSAFLQAASANFEEELYGTCTVKDPSQVPQSGSRIDYGYDCDSDLEESEDIDADIVPKLKAMDIKKADVSAMRTVHVEIEEEVLRTSPSASDGDLLSLDDCETESAFSEFAKEAHEQIRNHEYDERDDARDESRTPCHRPTLTLETSSAVLNERVPVFPVVEGLESQSADSQLPRLAAESTPDVRPQQPIPEQPLRREQPSAAPEIHREPDANKAAVPDDFGKAGDRELVITDSAHRTWQALLLYLYNDHLHFADLRSEGRACSTAAVSIASPQCSPKSMYRLADKLGLADLKEKAFNAIEQRLSKKNIVNELFSDFTWRYPEVLKMQTEIFYRHSSEPVVQAAMSETFEDIAYGLLPHSSVVLDSLFKKFARTAQPAQA